MDSDERQPDFDFGPPLPRVRDARPDERKTLLEVVGRAFFDDPVAEYLFPDPETRRRRYEGFAGIAIDAFHGHGRVLTTSAVEGAAIWQAPSPPAYGAGRQLRMAFQLLRHTRSAFLRATRLGDLMSRHHPEEPHWYLAILATDPPAQGRGIGGALMRPILERCDKDGTPAYLESSKASNVPFYRKHGFETLDEIEIPDGPTLWPMLRSPR